jgi:hypothetical protein
LFYFRKTVSKRVDLRLREPSETIRSMIIGDRLRVLRDEKNLAQGDIEKRGDAVLLDSPVAPLLVSGLPLGRPIQCFYDLAEWL